MFTEKEIYLLGARPPALMTAEEERNRARRIVSLRQDLWRLVLEHPHSIRVLVETLEGDHPTLLRRLRRLARTQTEGGVPRASNVERLAAELHGLDRDGSIVRATVDAIAHRAERDLEARPRVMALQRVLEAAQAEKHRFVMANVGLVFKIAGRFRNRGLPLHDLVQEGCLGLLKAVDLFDPARGFRFSTYAVWWIRHAIGRGLADRGRTVRVPVHLVALHAKANRVRREVRQQAGEDPTTERLADLCHVAPERIVAAERALDSGMLSLDHSRREGGEVLELPDEDAFEALDSRVASERIGDAIGALDEMEADIVRKRFGLTDDSPMTLQEIGRQYALSRERIRQIELKAIQKMRAALQVDAA